MMDRRAQSSITSFFGRGAAQQHRRVAETPSSASALQTENSDANFADLQDVKGHQDTRQGDESPGSYGQISAKDGTASGYPHGCPTHNNTPSPMQPNRATIHSPASLNKPKSVSPQRSNYSHREQESRAPSERPSTPVQSIEEHMLQTGQRGAATPTRTLFEPDQSGNGKSKRTFDVALLSPHKTKPPVKVPKTSMPTIDPEAAARKGAAPICLSSPILSYSPRSREIPQRAYGRDAEIAESGDELDYSSSASSDSSFPDLDFLVPPRAAVQQEIPTSDRSGRRKSEISAKKKGSTPNSRLRNKFDMKTLLDHQRRDDLMNSNFERLEAADLQAKEGEEAEPTRGVVTASPNTVRRQFVDVAGVKEETAGKALRAMERTEAVNADRNRWYFFKPCRHACAATEPPEFPKHAATGPWALLAKDWARARHFENGTLKTLASRMSVPDEIFLWVLRAIAKEKKYALRQSYYQFVSFADPEQVQRLVSPECLLEVFENLGAVEDFNNEQLLPVQEEPGVYRGKDWSQLQAYLKWLSNESSKLEPDALNTAVTSLLRMAVDRCLLDNPDLLRNHQDALKRLVEAVDPTSWDRFCERACACLYNAFDKDCLRLPPLLCMAQDSASLRELRRRMAVAFLLGDLSLAREHPDHGLIIQDIIERLKHDDFRVHLRSDYVELRARMQLLDIAVDDGSYLPPGEDDDVGAEKDFNAKLDDLTKRLRVMWSRINDAGALYLSRTEAKSAIDAAQNRLAYSVRTRPPPKQDIFDEGESRPAEVSQKQKDFMSNYLRKMNDAKETGSQVNSPRVPLAGFDHDSPGAEASFVTAAGDMSFDEDGVPHAGTY